MSSGKKTKRELIEIEARLEELERLRPFLKSEIYYNRKDQLVRKQAQLSDKLETGDIAPDVQYIITEMDEQRQGAQAPFLNFKFNDMNKTITVWNYIRVKFLPGTDPKGKREKLSRPKRIFQIIYDEYKNDELINTRIEYAPAGVKGTSRRIDPTTFTTTWENAGKTPTPRPLRKYNDEKLKELGYSISEINKIRERNFRAKDVKVVAKKLKIKTSEARNLLIKHNGSMQKVYNSINEI